MFSNTEPDEKSRRGRTSAFGQALDVVRWLPNIQFFSPWFQFSLTDDDSVAVLAIFF